MSLTNVNFTAGAGGTSSQALAITDGAGNLRKVIAIATQVRTPVDITALNLTSNTSTSHAPTASTSISSPAGNHRVIIAEWIDGDIPAGGGPYTVSANGSGIGRSIVAVSASNAKQSTFTPITGAASTGTAMSAALTADAGSYALIGEVSVYNVTKGASQTNLIAPTNGSTNGATTAISYKTADTNISYTQQFSENYAFAAIALEPAASGPTISGGSPANASTVGPAPTISVTTNTASGTGRIVLDSAANMSGITVHADYVLIGRNANNVAAAYDSGDIAINSTTISKAFSGLATGSYTWAMAQNSGGNSNVLTGTLIVDATAPNFSVNPFCSAIASTTATVGATSSEAGSAAIVVTAVGAAQPVPGVFDASAFTANITANTPFTIDLTGLTAAELAVIWVRLKDTVGNPAVTSFTVLMSHAGYTRLIAGTPNADTSIRLQVDPDIVAGDIIDYNSVVGTGTVVVNPDLTHDESNTVTSFDFYVGNSVDGWGIARTQYISVADTTAPQFTVAAAIANLQQTSFSITGTPNEGGSVAVIVTSPSASQPLDAAFDASVEQSAVVANQSFSVPHTGATADTQYKVWVQLKDQATTPNRTTVSLLVTTPAVPDTTAPNFIAGIAISNIAQNTADFAATPDEGGIYGLVVLVDTAANPSIGAVLAGNVSGAVFSRAQTSMSANVEITAALTGMVAAGSYKLHAALQDAGGSSRLVSSGVVTMAAAVDSVDPTISISVSNAVPLHTFTASPADNVGVVGVQFYVNDQPSGAELISAPWQFAWSDAGQLDGTYTITAHARDAAGRVGVSNAIQVVVSTAEAPPPQGLIASGGPGLYEPEGEVWRRIQER